MLITVKTRTGQLHLSAFSFDQRELDAVDTVMRKAGLSAQYEAAKRPLDKRPGRLYRIRVDEAYKLEELLQVRFSTGDGKTRITVDEGGNGGGYRCERVSRRGMGRDCVDLDAHSLEIARVKCALLARSKKWFGGVAQEGPCPGKRGT
jgi:hypothetical protein